MPVGSPIPKGSLRQALSSLDVDEGVRIESFGKKMFVNRNLSGLFVSQIEDEFYYLYSADSVVMLAKKVFKEKRVKAWLY